MDITIIYQSRKCKQAIKISNTIITIIVLLIFIYFFIIKDNTNNVRQID